MACRLPIYIFILFVLLIVAGGSGLYAQTFCPPNLNFEQGNLANWQLYTGACCPVNANVLSGAINNRHVLQTGNGTDPYGGFPVVAPGGGSYSLKLGNDSIGKQAERARYYIKVPNNQGNNIFVYRYAVVFQDPKHDSAHQPRFVVNAIDSATQQPIPCNQFVYVSSSSLPGFTKSTKGANVYYKPWTSASIDLSGYAGRTVAIDFSVGDCALGAHFGYGYVDVNCGFFEITGVSCNGNSTITLNAPPGYKHYKWMDTAYTAVVDTLQQVIIKKKDAVSKYAIIVTPYNGFGCEDTFLISYNVDTADITSQAWPDTSVCKGSKVTLNANGNSPYPGIKYSWYPTGGLSCTQCQSPVVTPTAAGTYYVVVTDTMGCKDTSSATISILPHPGANAGPDVIACVDDSVSLTGSGTDVKSFIWYPVVLMKGANTLTPKARVNATRNYYLAMVNSYGCRDTDVVVVSMHPPVLPDAGPNITGCPLDKITLQATGGVTYRWNPATGLSSRYVANPTLTLTSPQTYWVRVTSAEGCVDSDLVHVGVYPVPIAMASNDTSVCPGTVIMLSAWGGNSFQWYSTTNLGTPFSSNTSAFINKRITYNVVVGNTFGCKDTTDVTINVLPKPEATATGNSACFGDTATIYATGGGKYMWTPATGMADPTAATQTLVVNNTGSYTVVVTNHQGCTDTATAVVNMHPLPDVSAGNDTTICAGDAIQLKASGGVKYKWSSNIPPADDTVSTPWVIINKKQVYKVAVTNIFNCHDSDEVIIDVFPPKKFVINRPSPVCIGESATLSASGGDNYTWYPEGTLSNSNSSTTTATPSVTTRYSVIVKELLCNTVDTLSTTLTVNPLPDINITVRELDCGNEYGTLLATGAKHYTWSPADGLKNPNSSFTHAAPENNTVYTVQGIDENGCTNTASALLEVYRGKGRLFIPDAFTPNGDGINDCYKVFVPGDVTQFYFSIYNRFGERVFHATDRNHCWNGYHNGAPAELATYVYYYVAESSACGRVFRKGNMHLIR